MRTGGINRHTWTFVSLALAACVLIGGGLLLWQNERTSTYSGVATVKVQSTDAATPGEGNEEQYRSVVIDLSPLIDDVSPLAHRLAAREGGSTTAEDYERAISLDYTPDQTGVRIIASTSSSPTDAARLANLAADEWVDMLNEMPTALNASVLSYAN